MTATVAPIDKHEAASPLERARALRRAIRDGRHTGQTSGLARGMAQGNLLVLPKVLAGDFLRFCQLNRKPCPLLAVSEPGNPVLSRLGADIDIRTDVPRYWIYENGEFAREVGDLKRVWRSDFVAFVIGCSFSFEEALLGAGVPIRNIEMGRTVSMYRTSIDTVRAGPFGGPMVVSMRPMTPADAIRAIQICSRFPDVHGAPVHFGDPHAIGIADLATPDFGDAVDIETGEVPVFWACGVTAQTAMQAAAPPLAIGHRPGHMLVTDIANNALAML